MCFLYTFCRAESSPIVDSLISVGAFRLHTHIEGSGSPAIVIDAGFADGLEKLGPFQARLARFTRVITYSRAGYGQSEPAPLPRNCVREAEELKTLLDNASVTGPYILVGHSLGALTIQIFAAKFPEKAAGIVLLDPPPLSFLLGQAYPELAQMAAKKTAEWQAIADSGVNGRNDREKKHASFFRMLASEHSEMFGYSALSVRDIPNFGAAPLVVIAAGQPNPAFGAAAAEYQKFWIEESRLLSKKSSNSQFILVENSSHYLYLDAPEQVEKSIISLLKKNQEPQ